MKPTKVPLNPRPQRCAFWFRAFRSGFVGGALGSPPLFHAQGFRSAALEPESSGVGPLSLPYEVQCGHHWVFLKVLVTSRLSPKMDIALNRGAYGTNVIFAQDWGDDP